MPLLDQIQPDLTSLVVEVKELRDFLAKHPTGEREEFLPFFYKHRQICSFIATFHASVSSGTHLKTEADLWGEFICDLVTGNRDDGAFVFVEFEDAAQNSVFRSVKGRKNSVWGQRLEKGFSQIVDWLYSLEDQSGTHLVQRDFGGRTIDVMGMVVVGRRADITSTDEMRLNWRSSNTIVGKRRSASLPMTTCLIG